MSEVQIKLVFDDFTAIVPFDRLFSKISYIKENNFYCAEIDPPIPFTETESLEIVYFEDFIVTSGMIKFFIPQELNFKIPENIKCIALKIVEPAAAPMLKALNSKITCPNDQISAHVFFLPNLKRSIPDLEYIDSTISKWDDLRNDMNMILRLAGKGTFGISIGIMETRDLVPVLKPIDSFFSTEKSYEQGLKMMIIIVSSFNYLTYRIQGENVSVENVPRLPKDIITRIFSSKINDNRPYSTIERRMIKVCLNGGIAVQFFDFPDMSTQYGENRTLKSSDFEQVEFYLGDYDIISNDVVFKLRSSIEDLKDHLFSASSEAAMRLLFWDPVINRMFQHGSEGSPKNYLIEPEWDTGNIFIDHRKQRIDYAVTFALGGLSYPMLLIEAGKDSFDLNNPHKDQSKLLGILSQSCLKLAYGLIAAKKRPEEARACGIWIGGLVIQILVAHPVITKLQDGKFEIHANISINPHWLYDLNKTVPRNCDDVCCKPSREGSFVFERLKEGELNLENYDFITETIDQALENSSLKESDISKRRSASSSPSSSTTIPSRIKIVQDNINETVLKKLNFFIQYVKNRISFILSEDSNGISDTRNFKYQPKIGVFVESRESSVSITPHRNKLSESFGQKSLSSPLSKKGAGGHKSKNFKSILKTKNSLKELKIYLKLAIFPNHFPVVYDFIIESYERQEICYEFEKMEMITESARMFVHDNSLDLFYAALKFVLDSLYGLYILHEVVGVIHSDISPNNIMYSHLHDTWKLNDFNHSLEVSESLKTKRVAGTPCYIAPESLESGIFSKQSDIFSLGQVFVDIFDFIILRQICVNEDDENITEEIRELGCQFGVIIRSMNNSNPSSRPSIITALDKIFKIIKNAGCFVDKAKFSSIDMIIRKHCEIEQIQKSLEKFHVDEPVDVDPKRRRIEEKEQIFLGSQTIE